MAYSPELSQDAQTDFFLSYHSADRRWAEWIAWELEEKKYSTTLEAWDFQAGDNAILKIDQATKAARRTIMILSPDYLHAPQAQAEWAAAFRQDPTGQNRTLLPVRVRECSPQGLLASLVYIDLVGLDNLAARTKLLAEVKGIRAKPPIPPSFPGVESIVSVFQEGVQQALSVQPPFPQNLAPITKTVEIFFAYAKEDEDMRNQLARRLKRLQEQGVVKAWYDGEIIAGSNRKQEINKHLNQADIILLLISADFLASDECYQIEQMAMARHRNRSARVIPILLRACDWEDAFEELEVLPANHTPVKGWGDRDEAFKSITKGIRNVVNQLIR